MWARHQRFQRAHSLPVHTQVHPVWPCRLFNDKAATYNIDGTNTTGIFSFDLTLAEIKQLRAIQPLAFRNQDYNGLYGVCFFIVIIPV